MSNFAGLRQVGEFMPTHRPLIKSVRNPLDKATVVSILPKYIEEHKVTIEPGEFILKPGSVENPTVLVVGPSSWWRDIDVEQPILEIPVSAVQIADSVVKDYCNGMLGCNMADSMPGLFFVLGEETSASIKTKYKEKIAEVKDKQDRWFGILMRIADSLWARSNGNPLAISDEMRMAAKMLGKEDKPWLLDFEQVSLVNCIACGTLRNPAFPVCPNCKNIDASHPASKELKFAQ